MVRMTFLSFYLFFFYLPITSINFYIIMLPVVIRFFSISDGYLIFSVHIQISLRNDWVYYFSLYYIIGLNFFLLNPNSRMVRPTPYAGLIRLKDFMGIGLVLFFWLCSYSYSSHWNRQLANKNIKVLLFRYILKF